MLDAVVTFAERLRRDDTLPPVNYKPKVPTWVIDLTDDKAFLMGPFRRRDVKERYVPDRQRSGTVSANNLKPYLLFDDARYVLGKAESDKESVAELCHKGYIELLEEACERTREPALTKVLEFLRSDQVGDILAKVQPRDLISFTVDGQDPTHLPAVQAFWAQYLAQELTVDETVQCSICGRVRPIVRILPRELVVLGQKCQLLSFNRSAFASRGKSQNENAPICFDCACGAVDGLDFLIRDERHKTIIDFDVKNSGLQNQLAVFWLKEPTELEAEGQTFDISDILTPAIRSTSSDSEPSDDKAPRPDLAQVRALLRLPWTSRREYLRLEQNSFCFGILSANKGRLVVRDWLQVPLLKLKSNLATFLDGLSITRADGGTPRPISVESIVKATATGHPRWPRALVQTAVRGAPPPRGLLEFALRRLHVPKVRASDEMFHTLAAVIKLVLTYGTEEANTLERLDDRRCKPAYLAGRLLAVLESAQVRATRSSSVSDRFFVACSSAPASNLTLLLKRAKTSHIPKLRSRRLGYTMIEGLITEIAGRFDEAGGIPVTLTLLEQAEFALGYYSQRASFFEKQSKFRTGGTTQ